MHAGGWQSAVNITVTAAEQASVGGAQVAVEESIDKGVDEWVGVAQPQQSSLHPQRDTATLCATDEGPGRGQEKEWEPADGERSYHHPERGCRLLFPLEYGNAPAVRALPAQSSQDSRQTRTLFHFPLKLHYLYDRDVSV